MWTVWVRLLTVNNVRFAFTSHSDICTVYALLPNRYFRLRLSTQPAAHPSVRLSCESDCSCLLERGWYLERLLRVFVGEWWAWAGGCGYTGWGRVGSRSGMDGCVGGWVLVLSWNLWIDRLRKSWVKDLDGWVCWWLRIGSELGLWLDRLIEGWVKELDGWVCWWLSVGSELRLWLDRLRELGQVVGWLGSAIDRWQCLECERWIGQVAKCSLRNDRHNMGTEGNEGRNVRQLIHRGMCLYIGNWDIDRIRSDAV